MSETKYTALTGALIDFTEGEALINFFQEYNPDWTPSFKLSQSSVNTLLVAEDMIGLAFFYAEGEDKLGMQLCCPVNSERIDTSIIIQCGDDNSSISLEDAVVVVERFNVNQEEYPTGHFFGKDIINELLNQEGANGLIMYNGQEEDGLDPHMVIRATNEEGSDIVTKSAQYSNRYPPRKVSTAKPVMDGIGDIIIDGMGGVSGSIPA